MYYRDSDRDHKLANTIAKGFACFLGVVLILIFASILRGG